MAEEVDPQAIKQAAYYLAATRRLKRDFLRKGDAAVVRAISVIKEQELVEWGGIQKAVEDIVLLAQIGRSQDINHMADLWQQSRALQV